MNIDDSVARDAGKSSDAPMPSMIASPSTSAGTPFACDAMSEPPANTTAPIAKARRGPIMSPTRPPITSRLPSVREYPAITHCIDSKLVCSSLRIVGMATLRIVVSSVTITTAATSAASARF